MRRTQKWRFLHTQLEKCSLCLSSYKNHELKGKRERVEACERKKVPVFVTLFCPEDIFFNVCVLSQSIVC